jgi:hypothetical protein
LLSLLAACDEPVTAICTEIGCASELTIHVDGAGDAPVGLAGTITVGGHEYAVDCDGTSDPEVSCSGADIVVSIAEDEGGGDVDYGLNASDPSTTAGGFTGYDTVVPTWTEDHPNGEDCPPTCWTGEATAELFLTP